MSESSQASQSHSHLNAHSDPAFDPLVAHPARVYNVWLGGKDHYAADTPDGTCDYLDADLHDPAGILAGAARTLDFTRPAAILLLAVLHFLPDADDPAGVLAALAAGLAPGSFVAISHLTSDFAPAAVTSGVAAYNDAVPGGITARSHREGPKTEQKTPPGLAAVREPAQPAPAPADPEPDPDETLQRMLILTGLLTAAGLTAVLNVTRDTPDITARLPQPGGRDITIIVDDDGYIELRYWTRHGATPSQITAALTSAITAITSPF
jgi:hypothetical protein